MRFYSYLALALLSIPYAIYLYIKPNKTANDMNLIDNYGKRILGPLILILIVMWIINQ